MKVLSLSFWDTALNDLSGLAHPLVGVDKGSLELLPPLLRKVSGGKFYCVFLSETLSHLLFN